jgi:uncharacterized protein (TIGR02001 family)
MHSEIMDICVKRQGTAMMTPVGFPVLAATILSCGLIASPATAQENAEALPVVDEPQSEPSRLQTAVGPVDPGLANDFASVAGFTLSANTTLASQYRYRGANLSGSGVALQGGLDIGHQSCFYAGVWASQLSNRTTGYGSTEVDLYGGYNWQLVEGITADVGVVAYTFPDAPAGDFDFFEAYGSLSLMLGPAQAKVGMAWDPTASGFAYAGLVRDNLYLYSDLSFGIPGSPLTIKGHLGYTDGSRRLATNSGTFDWSIGASYNLFGPLSASLEYVDAGADVALGPINPNSGNLVGKISLNF